MSRTSTQHGFAAAGHDEHTMVSGTTLNAGQQAVLLYEVLALGELRKPDGSRYETPEGYQLAEARAVQTASDAQVQKAIDLYNKAQAQRDTPTAFTPSEEWAVENMRPSPNSFPADFSTG